MQIKTNDRFDKLTNLDISTHYQDTDFYFMKSDFLGAFAHWVISQSPYDTPDITEPLNAFNKYISVFIFKDNTRDEVINIKQADLELLISSRVFETIPEIEKLNHPKIDSGAMFASSSRYHTTKPDYDFIDLGALARNIVYMLMRNYITQNLET